MAAIPEEATVRVGEALSIDLFVDLEGMSGDYLVLDLHLPRVGSVADIRAILGTPAWPTGTVDSSHLETHELLVLRPTAPTLVSGRRRVATLAVTGRAPGTLPILLVGGGFGEARSPFFFQFGIPGRELGRIQVVPEPGPLLLLAIGLWVGRSFRRRHDRSQPGP